MAVDAFVSALPCIVSFQSAGSRSRKPHLDLAAIRVTLPAGPYTTHMFIETLTSQLPCSQGAALPDCLLPYKKHIYRFETIITKY
jgi:hypothetical protein